MPSAQAAHRGAKRKISFISFISAGLIKLSAELKNITTFRVSNQRFMQDCMRKVDTKAVMTVKTKFAILLIVSRFI